MGVDRAVQRGDLRFEGLDVEVVKGLTEGETVVTQPSDRVKDGVKVAAP